MPGVSRVEAEVEVRERQLYPGSPFKLAMVLHRMPNEQDPKVSKSCAVDFYGPARDEQTSHRRVRRLLCGKHKQPRPGFSIKLDTLLVSLSAILNWKAT